MKNQYVGDIGDYGKYSLLRFLSLHGIQIGINWYLTENDQSSDGRYTDYLRKDSERVFDPIVYDALQSIVNRYDRYQRTVQMVQETGLIPGALFYNDNLPTDQTSPFERAWKRRLWFSGSKVALRDVDLIFADPDNGTTYKMAPRTKGSEKYVLPEEIAQYYYSGKDVVFYCHRGRRTSEEWEKTKGQIIKQICDAELFVLTFHRGTQRSYIFVIHLENARRYDSLLEEFISSTTWINGNLFTREDVVKCIENSTPDICQRWAVLNYFQRAFPTKKERQQALENMTNEEIDELIAASFMVQAKNFYSSFKKSGYDVPTIGIVHPKGSTIRYNNDGTITIIPPSIDEN